MNKASQNLQKPGAGLPFAEWLIAKFWILPRQSKKSSWEECVVAFEKQGSKILSLCERKSERELETKVLIDRIQGIEDSSRHWSVAMTLEHLVIVGEGMTSIVLALAQETKTSNALPNVDIAKIKPPGKLDANEAKEKFASIIKSLPAKLRAPELNHASKRTHLHPWFGQMTAKKWIWLLGSHQWIHRKQIEAILKGL